MLNFITHLRPLEILVLGHFSAIVLAFVVGGVVIWKSRARQSAPDSKAFAMAAEERSRRSELPYINVGSALPTENYGCQVNNISLTRSLLD